MRFHAPKNIYGPNLLRTFIDELGGIRAVHKYLGVSERTVYQWLFNGRAPRAAVLALYWESKYGRSQIFADQVNEIRFLYSQTRLLHEQYQRAKDIITGLRALHSGSANEAFFDELPDLKIPRKPQFEPLGGEQCSPLQTPPYLERQSAMAAQAMAAASQ